MDQSKTLEELIQDVSRDIQNLVILRDTGLRVQASLDQKYWERDELVQKQKKE